MSTTHRPACCRRAIVAATRNDQRMDRHRLDRSGRSSSPARPATKMSQMAAAELRARRLSTPRVLAGGYAAWSEAGLPLVDKAALDRFAPKRPSLWVTRRRPKIDRVACPWLIRRFLDAEARILFVDPPEVPNGRRARPARSRSTSRASRFRHEGRALLVRHHAQAVRPGGRAVAGAAGADRARRRHRAARSRAGSRRLHAVSLGLSALAGDDDHGLLRRGFMVYDALFACCALPPQERHNWPAKAA